MNLFDMMMNAEVYTDDEGCCVTGGCFVSRESVKPQEPAACDEVLHVGPTFKVFISKSGLYEDKINFVDKNNRLVGYSYWQHCCETFGWQITDSALVTKESLREEKKTYELDGYTFDSTFFLQRNLANDDYAEHNVATFRLHKKGGPDKFLHIFNFHNGYYSHGFTFSNDDKVIRGGTL